MNVKITLVILLKIAVCDDEKVICESLYKILMKIADDIGHNFEIDCFTTGEELCEEMNFQNYDLIFLDIELPKMNGLEVGRYIRETLQNEVMQIAFISSRQEYAMQLFEIRPINFLVKPISYEQTRKIIDKFLKISGTETGVLLFKKGHEYLNVAYADILYLYSAGRKINVVTIKESYSFYGSLDDIYGKIKNNDFLYVHKSYIVNYRYVKKYEYERLLMINSVEIPISQSRRKAVRSKFLKIKESEIV